jgi:plastocyanin
MVKLYQKQISPDYNNLKKNMKGYIYAIIAIVLIAIGGIIYYVYKPNMYMNPQTQQPGTQQPGNSQPGTGTPTPGNSAITIQNFSFNPNVTTITAGSTVTWTNNDSTAHTITSNDSAFTSSAVLSPGQSYSYTFTNTGTYDYHCAIHTFMTGKIIVQ